MTRVLIDERLRADGSCAQSFAERAGERVRVIDDDGVDGELSVLAVERVMIRYGKPLDEAVALPAVRDGETLDLGDGRRLRRWRYHTPVDAMGRDYLVWERPGEEPLAVIATTATAALRYLVLRNAAE